MAWEWTIQYYRAVRPEFYPSASFRICALCRHFQVYENQREFPQIADTEYLKYGCAKLGWRSREDYLMSAEPTRDGLQPSGPLECPYWEAPEP